jgi:hypothetical protein
MGVSSSSRSRQSSSRRSRGSSPHRGSSNMGASGEPRVRTPTLRGDKTGTIVRGFGWAGVAPRPRFAQ